MRAQLAIDFLAPVAQGELAPFHPLIGHWFSERVGKPSPPQQQGWPKILSGANVLISAPTGSGKTLTAFLASIDLLFRKALDGSLEDKTYVVYVSPLKALGNDVQKNLLRPLEEIQQRAAQLGLKPLPIRVQVRTGDTASSERAAMVKKPPHILITTPESLYLCLTAERSRAGLRDVHAVIVDEIHALVRDKRGSHFSLSLERLKALMKGKKPQLIGLSATQKPLSTIASFLVGENNACERVEIGHLRPLELSVEVPDEPLAAVASNEMWGQLYDKMVAWAQTHRTLLVFTNTRRLSERVAHDLGERLGHDKVSAHHGSMSRHLRLSAEERLKAGQLKVMVATASLELGIDIGSIDLVVQLGSPRAIFTALQRVGRAGHQYGGISKGILVAMTRDELIECGAVLRAIKEGVLDAVQLPEKPLDILAQQVVAACASEEWGERELYEMFKRAYPYRNLSPEEFERVLSMVSDGMATSHGGGRVHLHRDRVNRRLRARRGARLSALLGGGAIPDTFTYPVVAEPEGKVVGTLDEDFAVESMAGDIFLLGSTSWRIQSVRGGTVRVENAHGQPPTVPFWLGEAPSRTAELSFEVARFREDILQSPEFLKSLGLQDAGVSQAAEYVLAAQRALGAIPSTRMIVAERFFDEGGGMQLILHAPFGGRINRAWGLALRKRFCRSFDFELQAAATDDAVLLSLGEQHSFPLAEIFDFLSPSSVEKVLVQAVLQSPLFGTRFRHNATRSLLLSRSYGGKRVPPQVQRIKSEQLLASVFPAQVGCQDNHGGGDIEVPDHPLVTETLENCLREAMDVEGLKQVLQGLRDGSIQTRAVDLPEPSVLAHHILSSAPYTYLDDAPLEERRSRAVTLRRVLPAEEAASFGALDENAIAQVVEEASPLVRDADELHDALLQQVLHPPVPAYGDWFFALAGVGRAARFWVGEREFWVATERLHLVHSIFPGVELSPPLSPLEGEQVPAREQALAAVLRGHMEGCGPTTVPELSSRFGFSQAEVEQALLALESTGQLLRGTFRRKLPASAEEAKVEWCDRRLLQRIHRLTVGRLRREIEPLSSGDFMRFLFRWQRVDEPMRGPNGLLKAISTLQGYEAPAGAWEMALLPLRIQGYQPELLERACFHGEVVWGRLSRRDIAVAPASGPKRGAPVAAPVPLAQANEAAGKPRPASPGRSALLTFLRRADMDWLLSAARGGDASPEPLSHSASDVARVLKQRGAAFYQELVQASGRLPSEVEDALWELVAKGIATADGISNLRVLQSAKQKRRQRLRGRGGPGRWSLLSPLSHPPAEEVLDKLARLFLSRYGVVFRDILARESLAPPWRELLPVYRRLEARGEIRGGRFLAGFAGEQFAMPEAVDMGRAVRRAGPTGNRVRLSAVDPLNLTGIITPGPRVAATLGNWVTYVDGIPETATSDSEPAGEWAAGSTGIH